MVDSKHDQANNRSGSTLAGTGVPQRICCGVCMPWTLRYARAACAADVTTCMHHAPKADDDTQGLNWVTPFHVMFMHGSQVNAIAIMLHMNVIFRSSMAADQYCTDYRAEMKQIRSGVLDDDLLQFANGLQVCSTVTKSAIRCQTSTLHARVRMFWLQAWDEEVAAGLAAVATFQRCLGGLEASQPPKEATEVYARLMQLVCVVM